MTTGLLVREMVDMHRLAEFPAPFYKTVQYSSFDHRSTHPGGPDWFDNADGFGNEPVPAFEAVLKEPAGDTPGEYLICDVQQPGVIVRTWTARISGTIRMYLDGADTPVYDGPAEPFFMRTWQPWRGAAGLDEAQMEGAFFQRNAAYCPIGFAKSCRIIWTGKLNETHFYQIQIRHYGRGAEIETFKPEDLKTYAEDIREVAAVLKDPDANWKSASKKEPETFDVALEPGDMKQAWSMEGMGAIECLTLSVAAADRDLALRQTILHIQCDGYPRGQVQSPVGDFFGAAPGVNPYVSMPFTVEPDGTMTCRYFMPFREDVRIRFQNLGEQPVTVTGKLLPADYTWDEKRSMHFRARWRIDHGITAGPPMDIPFLVANGAGVYVGSVSYILNPNCVPSPGGNWWGEGDEKIFTDDDFEPSTFGTGSEDYYNYAWSSPDIFIYPYCGQPVNTGPANRGFVTNYRWHILDPLPFRTRFSFYMELFPHMKNLNMAYGRIGYHYARPGLMDDYLPITPEDVRRQELPDSWKPLAEGGAKNSVFYSVEDVVESQVQSAMEENPMWEGGKVYVWKPRAAGEELRIRVYAEEAGKYNVLLGCLMDSRSGKVMMNLEDSEQEVDLNVPWRTLLRMHGLRGVELKKGDNILVLRYEGGPENGVIGLDFLQVQRS